MKIVDVFNHRNGLDILTSPKFVQDYQEFLGVLRQLPAFRSSKPKKGATQVAAPTATNNWLDRALCIDRDWDFHPLIITDVEDPKKRSLLKGDYRKSRIEVEVQFGNIARYAYDLYKMAISLAVGNADVGIMVVPTQRLAQITGSNIAYFERARRELEHARMTMIVPLALIGIEPDNWNEDQFLLEDQAPKVAAKEVNEVRRQRGQTLVSEENDDGDEEERMMSLQVLEDMLMRFSPTDPVLLRLSRKVGRPSPP